MTQTTELLTPGVKILYLEEPGYGPNGSMTRQAWREACLANLLAGGRHFKAWQLSVQAAHKKTKKVYFGLLFDGNQSLSYMTESCALDFEGRVFESQFNVNGVEFLLECNFNHVTFKGDALFIETVFHEFAWFDHAVFKQFAWFEKTIFERLAHFACAEFNGLITFNNASFGKGAIFESAIFNRVGNFENTNFKAVPPSFRGVNLATTRLEFSGDDYFPKGLAEGSDLEYVVKDISFLKRLSDEHGQAEQALNFNAMELRARKLLASTGWGFKTVTWLYEVVSNFGRSFVRPLVAYALLIIFTLGVSFEHAASTARAVKNCPAHVDWYKSMEWVDGTENCQSEYYKNLTGAKKDKEDEALHLSGFRAAFEYTLYRSSGILDFSDNDKKTSEVTQRLFGQPIEPWYMRIWGVFKAIASTALLFLAALGLRNKYRVK